MEERNSFKDTYTHNEIISGYYNSKDDFDIKINVGLMIKSLMNFVYEPQKNQDYQGEQK